MKNSVMTNNKGFTLIELLAALVILTAIMSIAIPSISSSLERTKVKQDDTKKRILESAAELYVTDHKNAIYQNLKNKNTNSCYITLNLLDTLEENKKNSDNDRKMLESIVKGISYNNAVRYFGFDLEEQ